MCVRESAPDLYRPASIHTSSWRRMELSGIMEGVPHSADLPPGLHRFVREYGASYGDMPPIPLSPYKHTPWSLDSGNRRHRNRSSQCPSSARHSVSETATGWYTPAIQFPQIDAPLAGTLTIANPDFYWPWFSSHSGRGDGQRGCENGGCGLKRLVFNFSESSRGK